MNNTRMKSLLSASVLVLIILHIVWPELNIDTVTFGLTVLAALPWLSDFLQSAEFPGGWKLQFRELKQAQQQNEADIRTLQFLISYFVTDDELKHLRRLTSNEPFPVVKDNTSPFFERELRRLRSLGLINGHDGKGIRSMFNEGGDVKDHFFITERGREYLRLRERTDTFTHFN